ncbi:transcriptional regulator [Sphingomonadaceae bacterium jetA1]|uniref:transcriptional regulator n=1 Tax=Facivitalis istanbulensis TaxID=3075838 RepID=UPI00347736B0
MADRLRHIHDELHAVEAMVRADRDARLTPADIGQVIRAAREGIGQFFDPALFADPAFDMLLYVYLEEEQGNVVETSACYRASGVPRTTAVRWINMLVSMGLFESSPHPTDPRLALLTLTDTARDSMLRWLTTLRPILDRLCAVAQEGRPPA